MRKRYIYYYYDERNDDFAGTNIETIVTPKDYKYYHKNIFYRIHKGIHYNLFLGLCALVIKGMGVKIKNKKVLKDLKDKKKGYFIYGNHTSYLEDAVSPALSSYPRTASIVCNPDAINIKGIKHMVKLWGAYPVPTYKETYVNFVKDMETMVNKGQVIAIYPEAHIWPHYNKIRDFSDSSFYYPVKFGVPAFAKTTVYNKNRRGKYKMTIYLDGPFYPDQSLPFNEAKAKLCEQIKDKMKERVQNHHSEANPDYLFVKIYNPEEVRTDTIIKEDVA